MDKEARKISDFLNKDLEHIINSTGMHREWFPTLTEDSPLNYMNNQSVPKDTREKDKIVYSVAKALQSLTDSRQHPSKTIITLKFFDDNGLTNLDIADKLGLSPHTYYYKKRQALIEFNRAFMFAQRHYKVNSILDLTSNKDNHTVNAEKTIARQNISSTALFLDNLTYWQTVNLYITLLQARSDISFMDAKKQALANCSNRDKLEHLLDESLNSPNPKQINYSTSSN